MAAVDKIPRLSGVGTLTGTPAQVRNDLTKLRAEHVVALTLEHGSEPAVRALVQTLENLAPLVSLIIEQRQDKAINTLIEALVPDVPPPRRKLTEARMAAEARGAVIENGNWLTAAQVAEMAGFSRNNPSAQPNKWKRDGQIFAVRHRGIDYFPDYGLDPTAGYRPFKPLANILAVLRPMKDDWGIAYWFASLNSFLGAQRPQDLLHNHPDDVLASAQDEASGIVHG